MTLAQRFIAGSAMPRDPHGRPGGTGETSIAAASFQPSLRNGDLTARVGWHGQSEAMAVVWPDGPRPSRPFRACLPTGTPSSERYGGEALSSYGTCNPCSMCVQARGLSWLDRSSRCGSMVWDVSCFHCLPA
jgi:hypothetical protein